jgi:hypothetical protein
MKNLRSNKGVTLLDLTIYMIAVMLIIGLMTGIRQFFYRNTDAVRETARYAAEFDNFNAYFVKDVKSSEDIVVDAENNTYTFSNGTIYTYKPYYDSNEDVTIGDLYRNSVKIATNIKEFVCVPRTIYISNTRKQLLDVEIVIGVTSKTDRIFSKRIQYTLKYW